MDNKKFYIIGRTLKTSGIGAFMAGFACHSIYAISKGLIPIVDMKHYYNQYFKDGRTYKDNVWEYFFEQPCGYSLDDIHENDDCVISENKLFIDCDYKILPNDLPINSFLSKDNKINLLRTKYRNFFKFNNVTQEYVEKTYDNILKNDTNILGVLVRGTDYSIRKTKDEYIQPKINIVIKKVKDFLKKHSEISKIYIATEDQVIYDKFKKVFGDRLLDNGQYRYDYRQKDLPYISEIKINRKDHNYTLAMEYLSSLYILSKCKYFIGGRCGGTRIAWILSDGWDDVYIWNLGRYGHRFEFLKSVFELTNKYDENMQKYKELTILGLKFKLRRKNPRNK